MGKTYSIRKVEGGGGSSGTLKKKKRVLVSFPHSATPLLYSPGDVLTVIHATVETEHPVAVVGLERIQSILSNFQSSIADNNWRLIFVVPEQIASTFQIQKLEGDTDSNEWFKKVDQYILGINEDTLWGRTSQLLSP